MRPRHIRNLPAISEADCAALAEKSVAIIGCGGLGGYLAELAARVGIGHITLVDGDCFEESNLNRQLYSSPAVLGRSKAEAAAERLRSLDPEISVRVVNAFLDDSNALDTVSGCDAVLDALDNIAARRSLAKACQAAGVPLVHGAIAGWTAQAAVSMPGDGLLDILYPDGTVLKDKSALSFTPAFCAAVQLSLCVRLLTGKGVESGRLWCFDLFSLELEQIDLV